MRCVEPQPETPADERRASASPSRLGLYALLVLCVVGVLWRFPLFHIVPLAEVVAARQAAHFDAAEFATDFWTKQLIPSFEQATDAHELCAALDRDPVAARRRYGRSVGIGRIYFYFLRGEGTIVAVETSGVALSCIAPDEQVDLVLKTGLLFGNTIRDATGQLTAGEFANSQDFNAISDALNRIVEEQVLPLLKNRVAVGQRVGFVGCAEVRANGKTPRPLTVVPLHIEIR